MWLDFLLGQEGGGFSNQQGETQSCDFLEGRSNPAKETLNIALINFYTKKMPFGKLEKWILVVGVLFVFWDEVLLDFEGFKHSLKALFVLVIVD